MTITENIKIENLIQSRMKTLTMRRINFGGFRVYAQENPFRVYSGLTGALSAATFKGNVESKRLSKWRDSMVDKLGFEGQVAYLNSLADFGTLLHACLVTIWDNKKLDWTAQQDEAYKYFEQSDKDNGITPNDGVIKKRVFEYCKAAASLLQFVHEEVEEILSVEAMAKCDNLQIATPIDFVCILKKDKSICSVNIKTSGQFTDSHRTQVLVEQHLWNTTYPDFKATKTALLRGKDWSLKKMKPTFEFEIVEGDVQRTLRRLEMCRDESESSYLSYPKELPFFSGETLIGEAPVINNKSLEEMFFESNEIIKEEEIAITN